MLTKEEEDEFAFAIRATDGPEVARGRPTAGANEEGAAGGVAGGTGRSGKYTTTSMSPPQVRTSPRNAEPGSGNLSRSGSRTSYSRTGSMAPSSRPQTSERPPSSGLMTRRQYVEARMIMNGEATPMGNPLGDTRTSGVSRVTRRTTHHTTSTRTRTRPKAVATNSRSSGAQLAGWEDDERQEPHKLQQYEQQQEAGWGGDPGTPRVTMIMASPPIPPTPLINSGRHSTELPAADRGEGMGDEDYSTNDLGGLQVGQSGALSAGEWWGSGNERQERQVGGSVHLRGSSRGGGYSTRRPGPPARRFGHRMMRLTPSTDHVQSCAYGIVPSPPPSEGSMSPASSLDFLGSVADARRKQAERTRAYPWSNTSKSTGNGLSSRAASGTSVTAAASSLGHSGLSGKHLHATAGGRFQSSSSGVAVASDDVSHNGNGGRAAAVWAATTRGGVVGEPPHNVEELNAKVSGPSVPSLKDLTAAVAKEGPTLQAIHTAMAVGAATAGSPPRASAAGGTVGTSAAAANDPCNGGVFVGVGTAASGAAASMKLNPAAASALHKGLPSRNQADTEAARNAVFHEEALSSSPHQGESSSNNTIQTEDRATGFQTLRSRAFPAAENSRSETQLAGWEDGERQEPQELTGVLRQVIPRPVEVTLLGRPSPSMAKATYQRRQKRRHRPGRPTNGGRVYPVRQAQSGAFLPSSAPALPLSATMPAVASLPAPEEAVVTPAARKLVHGVPCRQRPNSHMTNSLSNGGANGGAPNGGAGGMSGFVDGYDGLTTRGHGSMEAFTRGMQSCMQGRVSVELLHAEGGGGAEVYRP